MVDGIEEVKAVIKGSLDSLLAYAGSHTEKEHNSEIIYQPGRPKTH